MSVTRKEFFARVATCRRGLEHIFHHTGTGVTQDDVRKALADLRDKAAELSEALDGKVKKT